MHPRTEATLEELRQAEWFCCVGVHDTDAAEVLSSWYEAIENCGSPEWEDLCLEAANQYRARLAEKSPKQLEKWNDIVAALKPVTQALVREKTKRVIEENDLPKVFLDTVDWDILHLCMEAEYADIYPPGFFCESGFLVCEGTLPMWLEGRVPQG